MRFSHFDFVALEARLKRRLASQKKESMTQVKILD